MTSHNYKEEVSCIEGVQFGLLSAEEIQRRSCAHINDATLYDSNGEPKLGGLFDPRMGIIERKKRCNTCGQDCVKCPGHFGHIELAKPVYNTQYISYIKKMLPCICIHCSKLLINKKKVKHILKKKPENRLDLIKSKTKTKHCGMLETDKNDDYDNNGCGAIQPNKYLSQDMDYVIAEWSKDLEDSSGNKRREPLRQKMTPEIILAIFKRISVEDAEYLGFNPKWCMPQNMIFTILPVAPPSVRPSVRMYNNQRSEDDLTHKYNDIIKTNNILKEKIEKPDSRPEDITAYTHLLQYHVSTLIDNDAKGANMGSCKSRGGHVLKTFKQRINGKDGRFRSNLMGKRVDFSARSVISPDANLNIEELGVPREIAMNLTYPEIVNKYNINKMYQIVKNGSKIYPGAKSYQSSTDGRTRDLTYVDTEKVVLNYGDIIHRHLIDGDYVLFNRQPSLHKMSMMAHKVRVMEGSTFRLNVDVCTPYNADFDGDEMNMHVPQSIQTAMELKYLCAVPKQIISPSKNAPIIKPSQDNLLGLYKITDDNVFFNQQELMNLLMNVEAFDGEFPEPAINEDNKIRWTGKQVFSIILPPITLKKGGEIIKGQLIKGQVSKKLSSMIVHTIFNEYGYLRTQQYMNDLQKIISRYMIRSGFSIGIKDLIIHEDIRERNENHIVNAKKEVIDMTKQVHLNIFENVSKGVDEMYEAKIMATLSNLSSNIQKDTIKLLDNDNRVNYMVDSGSKGSSLNIQQMSALLAQQIVDSKRIPLGFMDRSLPHFTRYDNGIESRGFVVNNFKDGLTPQEYFFHAMAGREGLIDTAVKTAKSGYLQRRLVKTTEDLKANHDYTVRNSNDYVVQFIYGEDGFNPIYLEEVSIESFILIKQEDMESKYFIHENDNWDQYVLKKEIVKMKKNKDAKQQINNYNNDVVDKIKLFHEILMIYCKKSKAAVTSSDIQYITHFPINFKRLIKNTKEIYNLDGKNKSDINPVELAKTIDDLYNSCLVNGKTNQLFGFLLLDYMSVPYLIKELRITRVALQHIIMSIKNRFKFSLVQGGEMVGPVAAQSIGEISTQLSVLGSEKITLMVKNINPETRKVETQVYQDGIGDFINKYYDSIQITGEDIKCIHHDGNTENSFVNPNREIYVSTVDPNTEKVNWKRVTELSRHPANGQMVRVITKSKRQITTTMSHSHLKRTSEKIVPVRGDELKIGDRIPVIMKQQLFEQNKSIQIPNIGQFNLDFDFGWFIGAYLAEGSLNGRHIIITNQNKYFHERTLKIAQILGVEDTFIQMKKEGTIIGSKIYVSTENRFEHSAFSKFLKSEFKTGSLNKRVAGFCYNSNLEFIKGILRGYFDGDGNVSASSGRETIRAHSISQDLIQDIARLLSTFGIGSSFGLEMKSEIGNHDLHTIKILKKHIPLFNDKIGSDITKKQDALTKISEALEKTHPRDYLDSIPATGNLIADIAKPLGLPGYSRNYKSCSNRYANGRQVIQSFIDKFENCVKHDQIDQDKMDLLKKAVNSDIMWDEIAEIEILDDPNELVYDIGVDGNHTFALNTGILTHNTLNSVDWETDMLFQENGESRVVKMGQFIDDLMDDKLNKHKIQHIPKNRTEYLELEKDHKLFVPSVDKVGDMEWCQVTAVTRHLPIGDLVKVTTESGREATATQQKSFLIWNEEKQQIISTNGSDLKIGDLIPITQMLPDADNIITHIDLSKYLPKTEWLYGTDFNQAGYLFDCDEREKKLGFWAMNGDEFTLPYSRSDAFQDAWHGNRMQSTTIVAGCVYPKTCIRVVSEILDTWKLNETLGFIVGIYLAEGWATDTFVGISNNDEIIRKKVTDWCDKMKVTYHLVTTNNKRFEGCQSNDLKLHSVLLARFFKKWMGTGSSNKKVPDEAFTAPLDFAKGILDGYISGDGSINKDDGSVNATSVSNDLIVGISTLANRFGIFGKISGRQQTKNSVGSKNIKYTHILSFRNGYAQIFAKDIGSSHPEKNSKLQNITLKKEYKNFTGKYRNHKNVILDPVKKIEFIASTKETVYDLSVPKTLNFSVFSGFACFDTFHFAGVGEKSNVNQGVPRLEELLAKSTPKQPMLHIFLAPEYRKTKEMAELAQYNLELVTIGDILESDAIYLEPDNEYENVLPEDKEIMEIYKVFSEIDEESHTIPNNPWVIRLEFNRREMIDKKITMEDINLILKHQLYKASIIYADDNSSKLIFRLRIDFDSNKSNAGDDLNYLTKQIEEIKGIIIKGVEGIEEVFKPKKNFNYIVPEGDTFTTEEEYYLETSGSNLFDVLTKKYIDSNRTISIDISEMYETFGIEAARWILVNELTNVFVMSKAETSPRHINLLCDMMTNRGKIMPANRNGINKSDNDIGPLAKCSFEETMGQLVQASLFGSLDRLDGVSSNIMVGQIPKCGTGDSEIILDEEKLLDIDPELSEPVEDTTLPDLFSSDEYCNQFQDIGFNLNNIESDDINLEDLEIEVDL